MYAIIKTGGKQYRVAKGDIIEVELLNAFSLGDQIEFEVLFINNDKDTLIGSNASSAFVKGEVLDIVRGPKITTLKYKPSHNICRKWGHRQTYSLVKITDIGANQQQQQSKGR